MEIKYIGHSSFRLKGKQVVAITDPFDPKKVGLSFPKSSAEIVTISHEHDDHNALDRITDSPVIVRGPGEYEIQGVRIYGYRTFHDDSKGKDRGLNTIYTIVIDDIRILHLGDLGHSLSDSLIDEIGDIDVLFVPVGGVFTIDAKQATTVVKQIEPTIVIPMHYQTPGLADMFKELASVDVFIKELDKEATPQDKLTITRDKLPTELEVVILKS